jgi:RNA polymerase sigma-70 factor, ECF subfamily
VATVSPLRDSKDPPASGAVVRRLPLPDHDAALVDAVRARSPGATQALFDRHAAHVRRVLVRVLGVDPEIPDLLHDVFVIAFDSVDRLEETSKIRAWLTAIAVHSARGLIRKRARRRLLAMLLPHTTPRSVPAPSAELSESLRATYRILGELKADERIPFALRFIDGMELTEVALACGISLATAKRRLARAQQNFLSAARGEPALEGWIEVSRWRAR